MGGLYDCRRRLEPGTAWNLEEVQSRLLNYRSLACGRVECYGLEGPRGRRCFPLFFTVSRRRSLALRSVALDCARSYFSVGKRRTGRSMDRWNGRPRDEGEGNADPGANWQSSRSGNEGAGGNFAASGGSSGRI